MFRVCCYMFTHPAPAFGHVQKNAVVLPAQHMGAVLQPGFGDGVRFRHAACHQPCFRFGTGLAHLVDPVQWLITTNVCPACLQCFAHCSQCSFFQRLKAGQHQHGREGIEHQMLAARVAASASVEDAAGIRGHFKLGNGVEQCLHGDHERLERP